MWWKVLLSIIIVDLVYLNYHSFQINQPVDNTPVSEDSCGPACQKYIDSKIVVPTLIPTPKPIYAPRTRVRAVSYVPIPGAGITTSNTWANLSGTDFYFDTADYLGLKEIYFEVNAHLFNGNGTAFIRLYDVTHSVWITGSEITTNNQSDTALVSSKVLFASGRNLIRVQAKSLTADTTVFTSGRLKIIVEN
ncbi:MAG: hypothetical protein WAV41_06080 [Microgenomates group bacterium]